MTDVTVEASCEHLIATTVDRLGGLHILVNNAGINIRKPALALSLAEFQLVLDTNLTGSFLCAWAAGRHMVAQRRGKVIESQASWAGSRWPAKPRMPVRRARSSSSRRCSRWNGPKPTCR